VVAPEAKPGRLWAVNAGVLNHESPEANIVNDNSRRFSRSALCFSR
jgi:hypothetical protein